MGVGLAHAKEGIDVECLYCKGTLIRKSVSYTATRKGYHLIIDDVPAWVCEQCGEPLYEEGSRITNPCTWATSDGCARYPRGQM
jgi:YgiT-type zinc finger domain-containing protein